MKVNELMIGDLVIASVYLCLDEDWNETKIEIPCRIEGISENGDIGEGWNFSCTPIRKKDAMEYDNFEDIEPIPLTPEILEANKFKFVGKYEWCDEVYVSRYRYRDENGDVMFEINYTPNYDGFTWKGIEINNVHELQHAMRLCGLNELADNFKVK